MPIAVWFFATEVARILDYQNPARTISDHVDEEDKSTLNMLNIPSGYVGSTSGRSPVMVNESGLYSLILRSQKEEAKVFKRWVTSEVLPSIRKTGNYVSSQQDHVLAMLDAIRENRIAQLEHEQRISAVEKRLDALDTNEHHYTIIGYFLHQGKRAPNKSDAARYGKQATSLSAEHGYSIGKTSHDKYGQVNTYDEDLLKHMFGW